MTFREFDLSIEEKDPPPGINSLLLALWYDAKGDWEKSHAIIQDIDTREAALIHAYLHRKEGDDWNADYWYKKAASKNPNIALDEEFSRLLDWCLKTG